jgi:hypothetical protein
VRKEDIESFQAYLNSFINVLKNFNITKGFVGKDDLNGKTTVKRKNNISAVGNNITNNFVKAANFTFSNKTIKTTNTTINTSRPKPILKSKSNNPNLTLSTKENTFAKNKGNKQEHLKLNKTYKNEAINEKANSTKDANRSNKLNFDENANALNHTNTNTKASEKINIEVLPVLSINFWIK